MKYVTIKDIANACGISKSTVSRALSGCSQNVSKETAQKIIDIANKMGYHKNEMAANLRHRNSKTIGIIVPESITSFYMQFTSTVQKILQHHGYRVILSLSDEDFMAERYNLDIFEKYRVDGILISPCHNTANLEFYNNFIKQNIPLVFFDRTISGLNCPSVKYDDYRGAFFIMEHLIYNGRKKILHLTGPDYIRNTSDRLRAYFDALKKHGIPYEPELVVSAGVDESDGDAALRKILEKGSPFQKFDSIFCFTEMQALGAKKVLQEYGYRIPQDVSLACMSGTKLSTLVYPSLTTVEQPVIKMAEEAARLLLAKIENPGLAPEHVVIHAELVLRDSTDNTNRSF